MSFLKKDLKDIGHTIIVDEPHRLIILVNIMDIKYVTEKANIIRLVDKKLWPEEFMNHKVLGVYKQIACSCYIGTTK